MASKTANELVLHDVDGIGQKTGTDPQGRQWTQFEVDYFALEQPGNCSICGQPIESGWKSLEDSGEEVCNDHVVFEEDFDPMINMPGYQEHSNAINLEKESSKDGHEFSDIGGAAADLSKMGALEIGDEVRAKLPSGALLRGEIEDIEGDIVVVRGKKFKKEDVQTLAEVEENIQKGRHQMEEERRQELEAERHRKRDDRIQNSVSVSSPTGSAPELASALQAEGYSLTLKYKANKYLEQAEQEYSEWTEGEEINEECAKQYDTMYGREWTLVFRDPNGNMPVFFEVRPLGTNEGKRSPEPIGLSQRDKIIVNYPEIIGELVKNGLRMTCSVSTQELRAASMTNKKACGDNFADVVEEVQLPAAIEVEGEGGKQLPPAETAVETEKEAGFNFFFPGQVIKEFYPEMQHDIVDYPNDNNSPMIEDIDLDSAMETPKLSYVSTSPAGGVGIGRDGKPQVLDGAPLRKENDIRGGMFMDEFHQQYDGVPGALLVVSSKVAAADEKKQFDLFLKKVVGEIAASFVAAFKVTSRPVLNKAPGIGEVQLAQVEQPSSLSSFNIVNTGSRVKYLLDKLNDGDIKEAINGARAQGAVWLDDPEGGYVYEVFVRAESIDTDTMIMKYTFITGTKESGE